MDSQRVHFLIISDQPSPNLCPLLDSRLKPDEIVLITPPGADYYEYQQWLIQVCQPMGIKCTGVELNNIWDVDSIRRDIEALVDKRVEKGEKLVLNNTCGFKPISIVAHEVFFYRNLPAFYLHNDWVRWLSNPTQEPDFNLQDKIKLPAFLHSHGLKVSELERQGIPASYRALAEHWIASADTYSKAMGILNYYAAKAESSLACTLDDAHLSGHTAFSQLLDQLIDCGLATLSGNRLTFTDATARFFANGGWLEELVFSELLKLRSELPQIQDIARSVEINWLESQKRRPVRNELDVMVLYDNRLVVIECKTSRFDNQSANDVVYKLGSLIKHLGGIKTTGILVSFHSIASHSKERAKLFDVAVCERTSLSSLNQHLRNCLLG
ncbi:DUF1887 family CARF protein [Gilvimarinus sp. SDUM040013]|uniref:DUF1887 family CARF protein n=1 Tax=Gilvimarinus gilvus TaxID=3058038 RepID=A0ABU4RX97_9GAMM|nr:DUF1887 family CARF protein [Gilvimarinus sp. SDUM040013]MDO3386626.1 DUF1887 family CARF protein [Gilvimarinus sp. SDUM040013]MDX6849487.1 DUF1887 family CARF protein [Gilvimarinus sp. SDUM040013]